MARFRARRSVALIVSFLLASPGAFAMSSERVPLRSTDATTERPAVRQSFERDDLAISPEGLLEPSAAEEAPEAIPETNAPIEGTTEPKTAAAALERTGELLSTSQAGQTDGATGEGGASEHSDALRSTFDGIMELPTGRSLYVNADNLSDAPAYMLIHGLGRDSASLARLAARLKKLGFGVVSADLHGHGRTPDQFKDVIDYRHNVEDIAAVIEKLDLRKVRLVGHSYGGFIALMLGEHPALAGRLERISAIVPYLQHLALRAVDEALDNLNVYARFHPLHALAMEWQRLGIPTPWSKFWKKGEEAARRGARQTFEALRDSGIAYIRAMLGPGAAATVAGLPEDIIAHPPQIPISVPVQIVIGQPGSMASLDLLPLVSHFDSDQIAVDFLTALRNRGVNVNLIRTKKGTHFVIYERPDELAGIVTTPK